ncbi:MAG: hypothetical protein F4X99_11335 [Gammaproteobacteria bacterium]|nr:hypothetical protein [Gammaproteobacteria bacterium]
MTGPAMRGVAPAAAVPAGLALALLLWPDHAQAQIGGALDNSLDSMQATLVQAAARLGQLAQQILLFLVVVEFVWLGYRWLFGGDSISEFTQGMLLTICIVSLAWVFATQIPVIVRWIAESASFVASQAQPGAAFSPDDLRPSGIIDQGLERAFGWLDAISLWDPVSFVYIGCAFISVMVMAGVLAVMIIAYAELYIVSLVGVVTLGFAGLSQTRGVAKQFVMALFAKGFKLMTLLLVMDTTERLARSATGTTGDATMEGALGAILLQVIGFAMIFTLPGAVERLVGGAAVGDVAGAGGRMVASAAMSGASTAGAVALGSAGGAAAGAAMGAKAAAPLGGAAMAKSAAVGALKGGWNWGATGREGRITSELGSRLGSRINRMGADDPGAS